MIPEVIALYESGMDSGEISRQLHTRNRTILRILHTLGIMRPKAERMREAMTPGRKVALTSARKAAGSDSRRTGDKNPARRPEVREKIRQAKLRDNAASRPEVRAKMSASRTAYYAQFPDRHPNRLMGGRRRSKLEKAIQAALLEQGIATEHGHRVGRYWPDLLVSGTRSIIEVDGHRWHDPERDATRDAALESLGYRVLHITDLQWNASPEECLKRAALYVNGL